MKDYQKESNLGVAVRGNTSKSGICMNSSGRREEEMTVNKLRVHWNFGGGRENQ